jgi:hypothetical protein
MEITLTKDQLAIVADRLNSTKNSENALKIEKQRLDDFILGITTANGISGGFSWSIKEGKIIIDQEIKE